MPATLLRFVRSNPLYLAALLAVCLAPFLILAPGAIALKENLLAGDVVGPNIDFYLLLDDSPSMAIPSTQAGINKMIANTAAESGGCFFACHESRASADNLRNPNGEDNYALARSLGITLRTDDIRTAVQDLTSTARTMETIHGAAYQMAVYTFDSGFNTIAPLTTNLSAVRSGAGAIDAEIVYSNNCLTATNCNLNEDTDYDSAMSQINGIVPNSGNGTNAAGDAPQKVLLIVTDGVEDEHQCPAQNPTSDTGCRQQYLMNSNTDWCAAIKNRGIRIAIVYAEYVPQPNNSWYIDFAGSGKGISSFQSQIGPQLQACASPGLYTEVQTDDDISEALRTLFQRAVSTAYVPR